METNIGKRVWKMTMPEVAYCYRTLIENREYADYRRALMSKGLLKTPTEEDGEKD